MPPADRVKWSGQSLSARALLFLVAAALLVGLYARLKGLGAWPLAADEYYIARSVQNVMRAGLPEYLCGGFYTRGLLFQYAAATLQFAGLSAELAPRLLAVIASLVTLPAVYLLGKRVHSPLAGLLGIIVLALSMWEIEMSRFGRMYAPFQAVFAWYLVFFLRYTLDRRTAALLPMLLLTVLGALLWEGAVFLALANFLPPFLGKHGGKLTRRDFTYLAGAVLLALPVYWFATNELRFASAIPALPEGFDALPDEPEHQGALTLTRALLLEPLWLAVGAVPVLAGLWSLRWVAGFFRLRWLTGLALLAAMGAALLHQFLAVAALLLLAAMLGLLRPRELFTRAALPFHVFLALALVYWTAFGLSNAAWRTSEEFVWLRDSRLVSLAYEFIRFPDVLIEVVWPWVGAASCYGFALAGLIAAGIVTTRGRGGDTVRAERALQVLFVCLILAASASGPPRHETRYIYFLYPAAVILALAAVARLIAAIPALRTAATAATVTIALGGFLLLEDFRPSRIATIDTAETNFRVNYAPKLQSHYHPRDDTRGAATWLAAETAPDALLINDFPGADFYFTGFDFTFIDRERDQRYESYACDRGTRERWGNLPLVDTREKLEARIDGAQRAYMVTSGAGIDRRLTALQRFRPRIAWRSLDGGVVVVAFKGG